MRRPSRCGRAGIGKPPSGTSSRRARLTENVRVVSVLLCDDVPELRELTRYGLEEDPSLRVVGEAGDGESGLKLTQELKPDVVLLDLSMPGMDGLEAIPLMRAA